MLQNKLLVDSDIFYSLIDNKDANHIQAVSLNKKLISQGFNFITINLVIYETATVLSHKINHQVARDFLENILSGKMEIVRLDEEIEKDAFEIFRKQQRKNTSFVDCANIAVCKKMGFNVIFSFDKIYKINGMKRVEID